MKKLKFNPKQLIVLSVIAIVLSSCLGQSELTDSGFIVVSTKSEYSAGYTMEAGKLKVLIPGQTTPSFTYKITGTYPIGSLILDQRRSDRTTNWNFCYGIEFPLLKADSTKNPSLYVLPLDAQNLYTIYSEPTTPAFYNELCADTWNEPVTNGELSKCWTILHYAYGQLVGNPTYEDDMMKFSAFNKKLSYKPGELRSDDFNKIVSSDKKEVFANFFIGKEPIDDNEYLANPKLSTMIPKGTKAEYMHIEYDNGKERYYIKIYKVSNAFSDLGKTIIPVYIQSTKNISSFQMLVGISDTGYANYAK